MKLLATLLLSIALLAAHAQHGKTSKTQNKTTFRLDINNNSEKTSLTIDGTASIAIDDKSLASLSEGGTVFYQKNGHSVDISSNDKGALTYTIDKVEKTVLDDADKKLIADCVQLMIECGVDAENRANRVFANKGIKGVLSEIEHFQGELAKEIYLSQLLKQSLPGTELVSILGKTSQYLKSDYYQSQLFLKSMPVFLKKEQASDAYLSAIENILSEYYQYTLLKKLFSTPLNEKQFNQALYITYQSKSDYYKSELIQSLLSDPLITGDRYTKAFGILHNLKNDYYQSAILTQLINDKNKGPKDWNKLIWYVSAIDSEYYQSEMFIKIAGKIPDDELLQKQLDAAIKNMKSDYYYGKVKRATGS